jgi:hypothetical protein
MPEEVKEAVKKAEEEAKNPAPASGLPANPLVYSYLGTRFKF